MDYQITFEFDNGENPQSIDAERIVSDPANEAIRVDIPMGQSLLAEKDMVDLVARIQEETPRKIAASGQPEGMFLLSQAIKTGSTVLLRFFSDNQREEAYIDSDRLVL